MSNNKQSRQEKITRIDLVRMKDLKNDKLIELITNIINKSLNNGKVPDKMKVAVIRPLFKQGKHKDFNNYRPISILGSIEKILETIVHNQLSKFIYINKIISTKQFGFQKNKSAESCLNLLNTLMVFYTKIKKC